MKRSAAPALVLAALVLAAPRVAAGQEARPPAGAAADFVAAGPVVPLPPALSDRLSRIRAADLQAHIGFLASGALEGRALGTRGLDAALEYVVASLVRAGVPPAGARAPEKGEPGPWARYEQDVPLRAFTHAGGELVVSAAGAVPGRRTFVAGADCALPELAPFAVEGAVVFAGYGISEPSPARDDYAGLDLQGKIALILGGLPPGAEWWAPSLVARYGGEPGHERYGARLEALAKRGARAVLVVETDAEASPAKAPSATTFYLPGDDVPAERVPPLVRVSAPVAEALLAPAGMSLAAARAARPGPLPGVTVALRVTADERRFSSRNIVGIIEGSDRRLRSEAVVLGAHVDHLGASGRTVYAGADDNASGVAALLEIARAFASSPRRPARTLVLAFWTGEEEGRLGSGYYTRHPPWPLARTRAYLNLDMIAHPWLAGEIAALVKAAGLEKGSAFLDRLAPGDFVEPGVADYAPWLCPVLTRAARGLGLALHFDRTPGIHGGSDYRDFARQRVPFIRFFGNYFPGYHEPTDTRESVDPVQVQKMARLALATASLLAE